MVSSFPLEDNNHQYQEGAHIAAIVSIWEKDAPLNENKPVLQLKLSPTNSEDKLLDGTIESLGDNAAKVINHSQQHTTVQRITHINSPFPRWAWQDGEVIKDTEENFDGLLAKYKEIWNALNSADIDHKKNYIIRPPKNSHGLIIIMTNDMVIESWIQAVSLIMMNGCWGILIKSQKTKIQFRYLC